MKIRKAIIPVAGLGTRFLPATKAVPKELLPIVDKPTIQYLVEELVSSGIKEIVLVTGRGKQSIMDYFDRSLELEDLLRRKGKHALAHLIEQIAHLAQFVTVWQAEPLGLGHAVLCASEIVGDEPFFVCLPDDLIDSKTPCIKQMLEMFERYHSPIIAVEKVPRSRISQYGVLDSTRVEKGVHRVKKLIEKPKPEQAPSNLGIVGRYLLTPKIFSILRKSKPGQGGEIQLTDALGRFAQLEPIYGYEFEGVRHDIGDKLGFIQANLTYGLKEKEFRKHLKKFIQQLL